MKNQCKVIGFDADDTLWENQIYYDEIAQQFFELVSDYVTPSVAERELYKTEMLNMEIYGYGARAFILSIIETALRITNNQIEGTVIAQIVELCKNLLNKPVVLLEGIEEILEILSRTPYTLILVTKGDLLDQERKLKRSNIEQYFHHIEIVSDKQEEDYVKLLRRINIAPENFMMVGNSLKSDVLPIIRLGGYGVHIPYHTTWEHEKTEINEKLERFWEIKHIIQLKEILSL
ncbi:MAG TPA: HAD family hydrolase [Bacteroidales bacterium]|mgnify:CR=1 FL=1|jgi:putative hydrolase of the HAD superfamily|nr:HAD family hydrolase [Bacteroidales bacterium]HOF45657.1 HAD family hydrolase [Bacteroidales bacterium]HOS57391.1 HAD family hydrolase [Bacteroidales bacterium]HPY81323.1 HAD family hydrolase [Bacteroidales bacterium]HRR04708.1 HAD family hydrolase [Bacteroidales bacterium]